MKSYLVSLLAFAYSSAEYTPDWESLDARPLPHWYDNSKIGIFIHWGVYSVPSYGSEWFWWNWKGAKNENYTAYMNSRNKPGFTYHEFASDFTAELWNPESWAELFRESGARYVVLTSKHHDGYALWPTKYSFGWNSVDVGPHRDLVGDLRAAVLRNGMKFGLYHSLFEWFNPVYVNDRDSNFTQRQFVEIKTWPQLMELIEKYRPDVVWSDGEWEANDDYWKAKEFIAWLFNESPVRDTVVTNDRWGKETLCKHGSFHTCADRFNPGVIQPHKWENAMTLDRRSWGHRMNAAFADYMTVEELIAELVMTISCGGNILVNIGPTHVGTIDPIFIERLKQMGQWLGINGEAIYYSEPWLHQNDSRTGDVWYTKRGDYVYAIILKYPYDTNAVIMSSPARYYDGGKVNLLGYPDALDVIASERDIVILLPPKNLVDKYKLNWGWTIRFRVKSITSSAQ